MADEWDAFKRGTKPLPRLPAVKKSAAKAAAPKKKFVTLEIPAVESLAPKMRVTRAAPKPVDDPELLRRLQRGELRRDAELDLHHMTEGEAHAAVATFLAHAVAQGWRYLLIITGRGAILRDAVPRWLTDHAGVRFFHPAARAHGGDGALYVVVRRGKKE